MSIVVDECVRHSHREVYIVQFSLGNFKKILSLQSEAL